MSTIRFTKMHGAGNDYIYVDATQNDIVNPQAAAIAWSDRHRGIGSDGLVLIDRSPIPEADFSMRIFNADGSEAMMCGNASRCIGKYVFERGLTRKIEIRLLTLSGVKTIRLNLCGDRVESVTVDMGAPVLEAPAQYDARLGRELASLLPPMAEGVFVSMGNPHYVVFTDDVDLVAVLGPQLERHPAFPERCNIELAAPAAEADAFRVRVWERGSGITMACGTGACATAVAAAVTGRAGRRQQIVMDGGVLQIAWSETGGGGHVYMTGPAAFVFDGEIEAPLNPPLGGNQ